MPIRSPFSFATFDLDLRPSMRRTFEPADCIPSAFDLSLLEKLEVLRRIFDSEADRGQAAAAH